MPSAKCLARAQLAAVLRRAVDQYLRDQARRLTPPHRMASAEKRPLVIRLDDTRGLECVCAARATPVFGL